MSNQNVPFQAEYHEQLFNRRGCKHPWNTTTGARELMMMFCKAQPPEHGALEDVYSWLTNLWENSRHDEKGGPRTLDNGVSEENWLLKRKHFPSESRTLSPELNVEVAIAQALERCERGLDTLNGHVGASRCGNSVAATSGLLGKARGAKRGFLQIDILRLCDEPKYGELIELKYFKVSPENPKSGLGMLVGAAFQAALYALSLILWHAKVKIIDRSNKRDDIKYSALQLQHWEIKTLANELCFSAKHGDPPELKKNRRDLLRELSSWLECGLNSVARKHPSDILDRPLEFRHSFHAYPDDWESIGALSKDKALRVIANRWDDPDAA